ncbi:MAG: alpha-L-rhamnosidase N-terminal domain-containing protein [Lachnospiraceae bacterium]
MNWNAVWIQPEYDMGDIVPVYTKQFSLSKIPVRAVLHITALGVYEAHLNGKRIGNFVLAPGWTSYYSRLQYQSYDITADLAEQNTITVAVGKGWYRSPMPGYR